MVLLERHWPSKISGSRGGKVRLATIVAGKRASDRPMLCMRSLLLFFFYIDNGWDLNNCYHSNVRGELRDAVRPLRDTRGITCVHAKSAVLKKNETRLHATVSHRSDAKFEIRMHLKF